MDFNKERFLNFARYDLTINKTFYRNIMLVAMIGAIGIAVAGFFGRYTMWKATVAGFDNFGDYETRKELVEKGTAFVPDGGLPGTYEHFNYMTGTAIFVLEFLVIMSIVCAGCWAHNLRSKQGRISELTLPATNLEKFAWHTGLMVLGGYALCIASVLLADVANALFTMSLCPVSDGIGSLTAACWDILTVDFEAIRLPGFGMPYYSGDQIGDDPMPLIRCSISMFLFCSLLLSSAIDMFGNAVKYKYNIILTYIAIYVCEIVLGILFMIAAATTVENQYTWDLHPSDGPKIIYSIFFTLSAIALIVSAVLPFQSYKLYKKAQVTSKRNK